MITAQEIREKVFEKAVFGGYDMTTVDEFMAEIANDLALLHKENSTLKAKMKVLADKVAEYRDNEEALRMAVVSAQKMGVMIESDAKAKSEGILAEAEAKAAQLTADAEAEAKRLVSEAQAEADALTGDAKLFLEGEDKRMEEARAESAKFIENMNLLCRRQLSFLEKIGELDFVKELREKREAEKQAEAEAMAAAAAA
ncbi:MAG: DivIVA domain-containing protein, partial [Oscillospiraceae bacterium]|nr:DivIVA domain-containing protein [Oscillospiraceae bacterium]